MANETPAAAETAIPEKAQICVSCHGVNGAGTGPEYPTLAGQHYYYLYVQLKDFKAGRRANPVMNTITANLSKKEMKALAQYFSEQSWPQVSHDTDPEKAKKGEGAAAAGQCAQCHLGGYNGDSRVPRLAGMNPQYMKKTMIDFKTKARHNSPAKSTLMESYSEQDLENIAHFVGGLAVH